jgi:hypothetical protein
LTVTILKRVPRPFAIATALEQIARRVCVFDARRVAGGREVQVIVGSRNSALLRKRFDPFVARATLRQIAPTLPPERHELVPIARECVKLDELAAIVDIEDAEVCIAVETLAAAIRDGLVPEPAIDREMMRLMNMIGGGTALAHLRRGYGLAKLPYVEDVVMSRRGGSSKERTPTLIFNIYRMTGDRIEAPLSDQDVVVGRIHGDTVLELKSHGTAQNYDSGPSDMHVRQTELNIELCHETTAHRPEDGIIIYGLAEDYGRLALHRVERRPAVLIEMLGKAAAFDATKQCVICPIAAAALPPRRTPFQQPAPAASTRQRYAPLIASSPPASAPSKPKGSSARLRRGGSRDHGDTDRCRRQQNQT